MEIGLLTLDVHLHSAESLKDKRRVIRSLMARVRARHNVAVAEVDTRTSFSGPRSPSGVASGRDAIELMFDQIVAEAGAIGSRRRGRGGRSSSMSGEREAARRRGDPRFLSQRLISELGTPPSGSPR